MVKIKNRKRAFTVVEILLTLSILGFILLMITLNAKKQLPDVNKARYKKAYLTVEKTVASAINDEQVYPSLFLGFKYTETAITEFGEILGKNHSDKFKDVFKFIVTPIKDGFSCYCYGGTCSDCFMTDDGIVYGIPDTDFDEYGVQENAFNPDGNNKGYVPITIYTDFERSQKDNSEKKDAMYIGVKYDGNVRIFYPKTCNSASVERYCKAEEYILSDTIKREGK